MRTQITHRPLASGHIGVDVSWFHLSVAPYTASHTHSQPWPCKTSHFWLGSQVLSLDAWMSWTRERHTVLIAVIRKWVCFAGMMHKKRNTSKWSWWMLMNFTHDRTHAKKIMKYIQNVARDLCEVVNKICSNWKPKSFHFFRIFFLALFLISGMDGAVKAANIIIMRSNSINRVKFNVLREHGRTTLRGLPEFKVFFMPDGIILNRCAGVGKR